MLKTLIVIISFSASFSSLAIDYNKIKYRTNKKATLSKYNKIFNEYSKSLCSPETEEKFWELTKNFRGDGYFIPVQVDGKIDLLTIKKNLIYVKKKIQNIEAKKSLVKKLNRRKILNEIKKLRSSIKSLLKLKYKKNSLASKDSLELFKVDYKKFVKNINVFTSYTFPVNHLKLREQYDQHKAGKSYIEKLKANQIYFFRKIVEDGAQNKNHARNDKFLRSLIDQTFLSLNKPLGEYLDEDLRYDLEDLFDGIEKQLDYKDKELLERLDEWSDRTQRAYDFYSSLMKNKIKIGKKITTGRDLISQKNKARYILKDWVLSKHQKAYDFWSKQEEVYQALFVLETILTNEVGTFDSAEGVERKDVAQVVRNRTLLPEYYEIKEKDSFYPYLKEIEKHKNKNNWLNVLFKEGEFSFSYYFISGNIRIYCPEMTRQGKRLRRNNLKIAFDNLLTPRSYFPAVRYFSRASMLGRIDMAKLWGRFEPLAERPGKRISLDKNLKHIFKKGRFDYYYSFTSLDGKEYLVVQIGDKTYAVTKKYKHFYEYRNPHYFRYFKSMI